METEKLWEVTLTGLVAKLSVDFGGKSIAWLTAGLGCLFLGWRILVYWWTMKE